MNKLLVAVATVFMISAILLATRAQTFTRVEAGGISLRMLMTGSGRPTVVFEAGAGGPLEAWVRIQPAVSTFARTISYDRAGNGRSQKSPAARDGRNVATELHTALQNAHASPPYVLVGHSLGGPFIRVFAGMYPGEVAGLVLVDPTQEDLIAWAKARDPQPAPQHEPRPSDEVDCAPATFSQAADLPLPADIPIILITGIGPKVHPTFLPAQLRKEVEKDQKIFYPAKLQFHKQWVEKFPGGQLIVTEKSGHGIPFEEPELVISAIRQVVERADKFR